MHACVRAYVNANVRARPSPRKNHIPPVTRYAISFSITYPFRKCVADAANAACIHFVNTVEEANCLKIKKIFNVKFLHLTRMKNKLIF